VNLIEEVPPALWYCEFECPLAVCRANCPRRTPLDAFYAEQETEPVTLRAPFRLADQIDILPVLLAGGLLFFGLLALLP
jgi:hypothetical protein